MQFNQCSSSKKINTIPLGINGDNCINYIALELDAIDRLPQLEEQLIWDGIILFNSIEIQRKQCYQLPGRG